MGIVCLDLKSPPSKSHYDKTHVNPKCSLYIRIGRVGRLEILNRKKCSS